MVQGKRVKRLESSKKNLEWIRVRGIIRGGLWIPAAYLRLFRSRDKRVA